MKMKMKSSFWFQRNLNAGLTLVRLITSFFSVPYLTLSQLDVVSC
jgi:hypothetical protein